MSHFTFVIYDPQMATVHADALEWGWTLVGYAESLPEPRADVARFESKAVEMGSNRSRFAPKTWSFKGNLAM